VIFPFYHASLEFVTFIRSISKIDSSWPNLIKSSISAPLSLQIILRCSNKNYCILWRSRKNISVCPTCNPKYFCPSSWFSNYLDMLVWRSTRCPDPYNQMTQIPITLHPQPIRYLHSPHYYSRSISQFCALKWSNFPKIVCWRKRSLTF